MFHWILMLRKLIASSPQREARCIPPRVKLFLEKLEERVTPSATGMDSQPASQTIVAALVRQASNLIAMEQVEASNIRQAITQEFAQKMAYFVVQLDQILGIAPNPQNLSLTSSMPPTGNGSGNGNGTTTITHIASKQQPSNSTQPAGNGSGSSSDASIKPQVSPGGPYAQGVGGFLWDPTNGDNASVGANWDLNGLSQVGNPNAKRPGDIPGNVYFDPKLTLAPGLHGNGASDITWDYKPAQALTIILGAESAYKGTQTINSNITIDASVGSYATSDFHLNFVDGTSKFQIDGNSTLNTFHLGGSSSGQFLINSGTTWIAGDPGAGNPAYEELEGVSFVVGPNATLIDQGYNALKFWASTINIKVQGNMTVYFGPNASNTQIDINGNSKDYIDVIQGTLTYIGDSFVSDTFTVPVMVENGGAFLLSGGATENGGRLIVKGNVNGAAPGVSNNASVYMKDSGSSVQLSGAVTLECDGDYYQASGFLESTDSSNCSLQDGPNNQLGTATIAGGYLQIAVTGGWKYATFFMDCNQLNFGGIYEPKIEGNAQGAGTNDTLVINLGTGTMNLQGSSALNVQVQNQPQAGQNLSWNIIAAGNFPNNQFNTRSSSPNTPLTYGPAKATEYDVTYP